MADGTPSSFSSEIVGRTLTKAEFVETIYSKVGLSRRDSAEVIELLFESIKETLARGEAVKISGFGNFIVREKRARVGRNPQTGKDIEISARRVLQFKASQVLKDVLNS
ncbi:MAG: integration host factor subunit alpha [Deltaproteobacteria bacterium]|nr:integration host factor subunit alpha [Deltaproteobacteria bacterium]